ncbi:hypothetical protein SCLCIDRAFT_338569 [Scleroderma citrinum Foug A]|uniref:Uncharacterized protein n=1 Tax=Scleroderma citrinum Foug A TaxID=1036808 RepID=A0A0C3DFF0_9AGAM|nr:hypothetical protein SCLCIDRAFT_338569 [Scleroderma citrinum Foug A]
MSLERPRTGKRGLMTWFYSDRLCIYRESRIRVPRSRWVGKKRSIRLIFPGLFISLVISRLGPIWTSNEMRPISSVSDFGRWGQAMGKELTSGMAMGHLISKVKSTEAQPRGFWRASEGRHGKVFSVLPFERPVLS